MSKDFTPEYWWTDEDNMLVKSINGDVCEVFGSNISMIEQIANMNLIAAAPEMYALLEKCERILTSMFNSYDEYAIGAAQILLAEITEKLKYVRGEE